VTQFLQLRSGNSGPPFVGVNQNDSVLWDTTERAWYVGPGGGAGNVSSVFGRIGAVVAATGDYDGDQVDNVSTVPGASLSDALDYLLSNAGAVASVFGRTGVVVATAGDYDSDQVDNVSTVAGASVSDALETLAAATGGVSTVFGRSGAVVATVNDYTATQVQNDSSVTGTGVKGALNTLLASIAALVTGVSSVYGRSGAVVATVNDYTATQVQNDSSVAGTGVKGALNTLGAAIAGLVTGVSSVYGRSGAVVATVNDYTATQVQNDSSVAGTGVKGALNTLGAAIAGLVTGVSSVYGRSGAVVAAANDYAASQVSNDSAVSGATVKLALDGVAAGTALPSQLPARGGEAVVIDLYPSVQQQGAINNGVSVNIDVAIAAGKRYTTTASVWVDDGAGGACLYMKELRIIAHQTGGGGGDHREYCERGSARVVGLHVRRSRKHDQRAFHAG
jgi:hypothetical protein